MNQSLGNPLISLVIRPPRSTYPENTGTTLTQKIGGVMTQITNFVVRNSKNEQLNAHSCLQSPSSSLRARKSQRGLVLFTVTETLATSSRGSLLLTLLFRQAWTFWVLTLVAVATARVSGSPWAGRKEMTCVLSCSTWKTRKEHLKLPCGVEAWALQPSWCITMPTVLFQLLVSCWIARLLTSKTWLKTCVEKWACLLKCLPQFSPWLSFRLSRLQAEWRSKIFVQLRQCPRLLFRLFSSMGLTTIWSLWITQNVFSQRIAEQ